MSNPQDEERVSPTPFPRRPQIPAGEPRLCVFRPGGCPRTDLAALRPSCTPCAYDRVRVAARPSTRLATAHRFANTPDCSIIALGLLFPQSAPSHPHVSGELGDCPYSLRPINSAFSRGWHSDRAHNRFHSWLDWFCTGIHPVNVWEFAS